MSQASVSSYFNTRKRPIDDDKTISNKNKVICLERALTLQNSNYDPSGTKVVFQDDAVQSRPSRTSLRQEISAQRSRRAVTEDASPKVANFYKMGNLSPQKKVYVAKPYELKTPEKDPKDVETSTKQLIPSVAPATISSPALSRGQLMAQMGAEEIRKKLQKSSKLAELKTKLNSIQCNLDRVDKLERRNSALPKKPMPKKFEALTDESPKKSLKAFNNIELEIISPRKQFTSPLKLMDSPSKNALMLTPKPATPRKLFFSPTKSSTTDQLPAYQRYQNYAQSGVPTLQLPFKYRYLLEVFKAMDTVCAMFYNRKEKITFKKMKPAVVRLIRKSVTETHLAQIHKIYPDSYNFSQEKTRNYGSTSKQDYYQLVITPNMEQNEGKTTLKYVNMSPVMLSERAQRFQQSLVDRVMNEHDTFLQQLEIPMTIAHKALKRWHPDFQLEKCADIDLGDMPQAPNVETFASAKDVLSAARNLFNCATPMEKALERLEAKQKEERGKQEQHHQQITKVEEDTTNVKLEQNISSTETSKNVALSTNSKALKGIPKALLDKIRAKQAAKALDKMTRRPSQDREAQKYSRLPELARHLRNVFITEKKGVLPVDIVLKKIENSYKELMTMKDIEEHLKIITNEIPSWFSFHEVRNAMFIKLARDSDFGKVSKQLEELARLKFQ